MDWEYPQFWGFTEWKRRSAMGVVSYLINPAGHRHEIYLHFAIKQSQTARYCRTGSCMRYGRLIATRE